MRFPGQPSNFPELFVHMCISACLCTLDVLVLRLGRPLRGVSDPVLVSWSFMHNLLLQSICVLLLYPRQSKAQAASSVPYVLRFQMRRDPNQLLFCHQTLQLHGPFNKHRLRLSGAYHHSSPATGKAADSTAWTNRLWWFGCWVCRSRVWKVAFSSWSVA